MAELLLVEDNAVLAKTLVRFLHTHGELTVAAVVPSAEAALEQMPHLRVDLLLVDVSLPGMNLLFQIVRKLLFNIVKHAGVNHAQVVLLQEQEAFVIQVEDVGQGFVMPVDGSNTAAISGLGLASVRRRLQLMGGRLTIDSVPGGGTCVTVAVPLAMFATSPSAA